MFFKIKNGCIYTEFDPCAENATKGSIVPEMYFRARVPLFASMHRFCLCGQKASVEMDHLYVIPFSRYCTLREMLVSTEQEIEADEDDEILKQNFRDMMSSKVHISSQSLENTFFKEIEALKSPEIFKKYKYLDYRIHHQELNEDENCDSLSVPPRRKSFWQRRSVVMLRSLCLR